MLKRKIYDKLIEWKNQKNKLCLMIKGARQVGKTYIIRFFGKTEYQSFLEINFDIANHNKEIFDSGLDADTILSRISLKFPDFKLINGKTLIFIDEIQNCPNARTALKFLAEDKRFDIIASGSLLGVNHKEVPSFPVGYVDEITMYSLDFEEFLYAMGHNQELINLLKHHYDNLIPIDNFIHNQMLALFKQYIVVGGMPRVVSEYITNKHYGEVLRMQKTIVSNYLDDIAKYAESQEKVKARECFISIPRQLAKEYKKFQYSIVEKRGRASKYAGSLQWLLDAGIISRCYNLSTPSMPFLVNRIEEEFKIYMNDTGLLVSMLDEGTQNKILNGDLGIYSGAIYENIIAEIFTKNHKSLYYYAKNSSIEIDFIIYYQQEPTAVEVKTADNTKSKSLTVLLNNYPKIKGIKLSSKNIGFTTKTINIPLYLSIFL